MFHPGWVLTGKIPSQGSSSSSIHAHINSAALATQAVTTPQNDSGQTSRGSIGPQHKRSRNARRHMNKRDGGQHGSPPSNDGVLGEEVRQRNKRNYDDQALRSNKGTIISRHFSHKSRKDDGGRSMSHTPKRAQCRTKFTAGRKGPRSAYASQAYCHK